MSGYDWDAPVHADVDDEARAAWHRERPDDDGPSLGDVEHDFEAGFSARRWRQENGRPEPVIPDPADWIEIAGEFHHRPRTTNTEGTS